MATIFTPVTNDSAGIQAAVDALEANGGGVLCLSGYYYMDTTVTATPSSIAGVAPAYGATRMDVVCAPNTFFVWYGAAYEPMFRIWGWMYSRWSGGEVHLWSWPGASIYGGGPVAGVVGIDLPTSDDYPSQHYCTFENVVVVLKGLLNIGFRTAQHPVGEACDVSFIEWDNCLITSEVAISGTGTVGIQNWGQNGLNFVVVGGMWAFLNTGFQSAGDPANVTESMGGGDHFFYGLGCSGNALDFDFNWNGSYLISGGRFENGINFVSLGRSTDPTPYSLKIEGVMVGQYNPAGFLIDIWSPAMVTVSGTFINWGGAPTGYFTYEAFRIEALPTSRKFGMLDIQNIAISAADGPVWLRDTGNTNFKVFDYGMMLLDNTNKVPHAMYTAGNYRGKGL